MDGWLRLVDRGAWVVLMKWLLKVILAGLLVSTAHAFTNVSTLQYRVREPDPRTYLVPIGWGGNIPTSLNSAWILARAADRPHQVLELGRRVVLAPAPGVRVEDLIADLPLKNARSIHPGYWVVEAPDAWIALEQSQELASRADVLACYPASRAFFKLQGGYAPAPNDPYFSRQWHLENRTTNGISKGADLNVRSAWASTRGEGVVAAVVDDGVEMSHPDLVDRFAGNPHFHFGDNTTNAGPSDPTAAHSTAVAGLIGGTQGNQRGISGVAPGVGMASWVIFQSGFLAPDTVGMKDMFQAFSNRIHIQNHSWGAGGLELYPLPPLESAGISNATTLGRAGRGIVMVRAASNFREQAGDANADGYAADPRVITVAAARSDGRAARYSNPGSCILVAGLSSETLPGNNIMDVNYPSLVTTDLPGIAGKNSIFTADDAADYRYDSIGFSGTSGATPLISGVVALMLSARPQLTYRDVQQALLLSARQVDLGDPLTQANGAGLLVSYNTGFGIPNAGLAVQRAKQWVLRPPVQECTVAFPGNKPIPDDGMRVEVTGQNIPPELSSIPVSPGLGYHADNGTPSYPVTALGNALSRGLIDLSGRAALIQRGLNTFSEKIQNAADAGAELVVIYDNTGTQERMLMSNTGFSIVPAVFMARTAGLALESLVSTNSTVRLKLTVQKTVSTVVVDRTWICEHVGVRVRSDHARRGDLRISLVSPMGTRSILQRANTDAVAGPADWTYYSVHHFFESTAGTWKLEIMDEGLGQTGSLVAADLMIRGTPIVDTDHDGLDDGWEVAHFGNLSASADEDPDQDGVSNAIEQALKTHPLEEDIPFEIGVVPWNSRVARLSWPGVNYYQYEVISGETPDGPYTPVGTLTGTFPETEWFTPLEKISTRFYRVHRLPR